MDFLLQSTLRVSDFLNQTASDSGEGLRLQQKSIIHHRLQQGSSQPSDLSAASTRGPGRWRWLLLMLLLWGLAEASSGAGNSLAQLENALEQPTEQSTERLVEESAEQELADQPSARSAGAFAEPARNAATGPNDTDTTTTEAPTGAVTAPTPAAPIPAPATQPPAIAPPRSESPELEAIVIPMPQTVTEADSAANAAERIYLIDDQVSFIPPLGFTAMSSAEIEANFSQEVPPAYVYANADRNVSIGITVSEIPLKPEQLPEVKTILENSLEDSFPSFQWLEHDFVNLDGQDWIKLEFLSQAADQRIHNDMYITIVEGKLLGFNFNASLAADPQLRPLLQDSRNSILLSPTIGKN